MMRFIMTHHPYVSQSCASGLCCARSLFVDQSETGMQKAWKVAHAVCSLLLPSFLPRIITCVSLRACAWFV